MWWNGIDFGCTRWFNIRKCAFIHYNIKRSKRRLPDHFWNHNLMSLPGSHTAHPTLNAEPPKRPLFRSSFPGLQSSETSLPLLPAPSHYRTGRTVYRLQQRLAPLNKYLLRECQWLPTRLLRKLSIPSRWKAWWNGNKSLHFNMIKEEGISNPNPSSCIMLKQFELFY